MHSGEKNPLYSYFVSWSEKDREFVARFLELPELSGLAPTIPAAIAEAKTALAAWLKAARERGFEIPEPSMQAPCMILDARFAGKEPMISDIPEEIVQAKTKNQTISASKSVELENSHSVQP